jgi:hypothetical protein
MRTTFILVAMVLLLGSFWGGREMGQRAEQIAMSKALKHRRLSDLRGCLFAVDSNMLRTVRHLDQLNIERLVWRLGQCDAFLDRLGKTALDDETSGILGEVRLFYDGYYQDLQEIVDRQIELKELYNNFSIEDTEKIRRTKELEEQQAGQIQESAKFLDRLELLIIRAW